MAGTAVVAYAAIRVLERLGQHCDPANGHGPFREARLDTLAHVPLEHVHLHRGDELSIRQLRQVLAWPLTPMNFSTWLYQGAMSA